MPAHAANIPADSDLLCESCGYTLNGLSDAGNCPECGNPIAQSTVRSGRSATAWETDGSFIHTSVAVTFRPAKFYRSLKTRVSGRLLQAAKRFALRHWTIAGILLTLCILGHYSLMFAFIAHPAALALVATGVFLIFLLCAWALTEIAVGLTTWEATWRGYRLPRNVVRRALHYHAAHLLPAALAIAAVVFGYRALMLMGALDFVDTVIPYLYVLSATAIATAIYLFWTYWIGMRNLMYANQ